LEDFALEVRKRGLDWKTLEEEQRSEIVDACLEKVSADYGNSILSGSARNRYLIERSRRILKRTVWALQEQLKSGEFTPEGFEVSFGGGRIDRLDILEESDKVYVKVIDYKTGNVSFDLVAVYHGLQLQLMIYLDAALEVERRNYPEKQVEPAGIFYYNVKDPMIQTKMEADVEEVQDKILSELKMNGLVQADPEVARKLDQSLSSIPAALNKDGTFRKTSSVATREQFARLGHYVQNKIEDIRKSILEGDAQVSPYELDKQDACTYCPYKTVCGYDRKIPGFEHRRLKKLDAAQIWKAIEEEQ
jgi:ATP-dependent helicase/nuclease subunit B